MKRLVHPTADARNTPQRDWVGEVAYLRKILELDFPEARRSVAELLAARDGKLSFDARMMYVENFDDTLALLLRQAEQNLGIIHTAQRARSVFDWAEAVFPKRVAGEEIGDALELIDRWRGNPACKHARAKIAIKVVSTLLILTLTSVRYVMSSVRGKRAE